MNFLEEKKMEILTGVLLLQKSFGRDNKNRLLFQCVPYNKDLPTILVPYEIKIGFQKNMVNKYVLFSFVENYKKRDIPIGILRQVLGDVSALTAYYDYLLYSTNLFRNKGWAKQPLELNNSQCESEYNHFDVEPVFTIDNEGTLDFDDAFRFEIFENGTCCISVYITDVASLVFTKLGVDVQKEHVWSGVSTLYMPHRRIPMLLDQISQQVRLVSGSFRTCVAVRFFYDFDTGKFLCGFCDKQARVFVENNWSYSEVNSGSCNELLRFTQRLEGGGNFIEADAKRMVAFWMVQYNRFMAEAFSGSCFRRKHQDCGNWMSRLLKQQEYSLLGGGEKLVFCSGLSPCTNSSPTSSDVIDEKSHSLDECKDLGVKHGFDKDKENWIIPMTNPIRRLVDLYNQAIFLQVISLEKEEEGNELASMFNRQMKTVAKIQRETQLLHYMEQRGSIEVNGVVYRMEPEQKYNRYFVYLDLGENLGMFSSYKVLHQNISSQTCIDLDEKLSLPFNGRFRLFYFCKFHDLRKKICVSPI